MSGPVVNQHETLRVPQGWEEQDKTLVIQLERILDDLYLRFGRIRSEAKKLQALIEELQTQTEELQTQTGELQTKTGELQTKTGELQTQIESIYDTAVTNVEFNETAKKITKTINGNTTNVVAIDSLKTAMAPFTWGQLE